MTDPPLGQTPATNPLLASETHQPQPRISPARSPSPSQPPSPLPSPGPAVLDIHPSSPVPPGPPSPASALQLVLQPSGPSSPGPAEDETPSGSPSLARPDKGKAPLRHDPRDIFAPEDARGVGLGGRTDLDIHVAAGLDDSDGWDIWDSSTRRGKKAKLGSCSRYPVDEAYGIGSGSLGDTNDLYMSGAVPHQGQQTAENTYVAHSRTFGDAIAVEPGPSASPSQPKASSREDNLIESFTPLQIGDPGWETVSGRPPVKLPIRFQDGIGRNYVFPWESVKTWQGMLALIEACFAYGSSGSGDVRRGRYDLFTTFPFPQNPGKGVQGLPVSGVGDQQARSVSADAVGADVPLLSQHSTSSPSGSSLEAAVAVNAIAENEDTQADTALTSRSVSTRFRLLPELWDVSIEPGMFVIQELWPPLPLPPLVPTPLTNMPPTQPPLPIPMPVPGLLPGMHGAMPPGRGGRGAVGPGRGRGRGRGRGAGPMPVPVGPPGMPPPGMHWGPPPNMGRPGVRIIVARRSKTRKRRV